MGGYMQPGAVKVKAMVVLESVMGRVLLAQGRLIASVSS